MNCGPPCFLNLNWDQSLALSSMVASPEPSDPPATVESLAVQDFVGEISAGPQFMATPLQPNLAMMGHLHHLQIGQGGLPMLENVMPTSCLNEFPTDLEFAERAAMLSCFDGRNYASFVSRIGLPECGKLSRVSSSLSLEAKRPDVGFSNASQTTQLLDGLHSGPKEVELPNARDDSSVSDPASVVGFGRKRKLVSKGKGKETSQTNSSNDPNKASDGEPNAKRCKGRTQGDSVKPKTEQNGSMSSTENGNKTHSKEPPRDYIHVRARRGEATDSHSLAERVRREKISQRLKLLQDLVPGCNKVIGKAVMLDEIINYVQSLQRQVEFLSMKLATVYPQLNFSSLPNILSKDMHQTCGPLLNPVFPVEAPPGSALLYASQPQHGNHPLSLAVTNGMETHHPFLNGISDAASQVGHFWQDDLQSAVHMDIEFNGPMQPDQMKMEL